MHPQNRVRPHASALAHGCVRPRARAAGDILVAAEGLVPSPIWAVGVSRRLGVGAVSRGEALANGEAIALRCAASRIRYEPQHKSSDPKIILVYHTTLAGDLRQMRSVHKLMLQQ